MNNKTSLKSKENQYTKSILEIQNNQAHKEHKSRNWNKDEQEKDPTLPPNQTNGGETII